MSGWQGASRLTSRSDDTKAVEVAATAFVEAYGTFDFRDPASYQRRLLPLTSGQVREAVLTAGIDPAALAQQQTMTARVLAVVVTAQSDAGATASVTAEQTATRRGSRLRGVHRGTTRAESGLPVGQGSGYLGCGGVPPPIGGPADRAPSSN